MFLDTFYSVKSKKLVTYQTKIEKPIINLILPVCKKIMAKRFGLVISVH